MVLETNVHLINLFDIDNIPKISRKTGNVVIRDIQSKCLLKENETTRIQRI